MVEFHKVSGTYGRPLTKMVPVADISGAARVVEVVM
jgi:hypothetical protein